jgi:hypothetical protein
MSGLTHKYNKEIHKHRQEIEKLNVLSNPTLEKLDERNKILSKIHTLNYKINNIKERNPELGYGIDIDKKFLTDK